MRCARLLIFAILPLLTGCTAAILRTGFDTRQLETREDVRREFGDPDSNGEQDGHPFDDIHTRRKVKQRMDAWVAECGSAATFGLFDLVGVPASLTQIAYRSVAGQDLRFVYDSNGKLTHVLRDGEPAGEYPRPGQGLTPSTKKTEVTQP